MILLGFRPFDLQQVPSSGLVLQGLVGVATYVANRLTLAPWWRRTLGSAAVLMTPDHRLLVLRGGEQVDTIAGRLRRAQSARREILGIVGVTLVLQAGYAVWAVAVIAVFGQLTMALAGGCLAVGCDLTRSIWWLRRTLHQIPGRPVQPTRLLPVMAAYVVASGAPYPGEGVSLSELHACLRRDVDLAERVRVRVERDRSMVLVVEAICGISGGVLMGESWFS